MTSQSGDDTQKPTAKAKIFLEDGTVLTGLSFGSHKSAEGEVRTQQSVLEKYCYRCVKDAGGMKS